MKNILALFASALIGISCAGSARGWCGEGFVLKAEGQTNITLQDNGVVKTITSIQIPLGDWTVTGAGTVQFSCFGPNGNYVPFEPGWFLYSYLDITTDPHTIHTDKIRAIDARVRGTWWFGLKPVQRVFCGPQTVYLVTVAYGQRPADQTQVFGGMVANRFH